MFGGKMNKLLQLLEQRKKDHGSLPLVMGILNVTPDSFSDGGRFQNESAVKRQIEYMAAAGADVIDIGGESTRPGAAVVSLQEELDRVLPAIEWARECSDLAISVDTYKTEVMRQVTQMQVDLINDVNALQAEGALQVVAGAGVAVCLMHKQGDPLNMQSAPHYSNVVEEVLGFLQTRIAAAVTAGVDSNKIILDPGFGFGKTLEHNVMLFKALPRFVDLHSPLLVGVSRKAMIGALMGNVPVEQRMLGSVIAALQAGLAGAQILRVHDVKETVEALRVGYALNPAC